MKIILMLVLTCSFVSSLSWGQAANKAAAASVGTQPNFQDQVAKLRPDDEGVVVLFEKAKGSYYLPRDTGRFDNLRHILEESLKNKKPVSVTTDASRLNIVDVK